MILFILFASGNIFILIQEKIFWEKREKKGKDKKIKILIIFFSHWLFDLNRKINKFETQIIIQKLSKLYTKDYRGKEERK